MDINDGIYATLEVEQMSLPLCHSPEANAMIGNGFPLFHLQLQFRACMHRGVKIKRVFSPPSLFYHLWTNPWMLPSYFSLVTSGMYIKLVKSYRQMPNFIGHNYWPFKRDALRMHTDKEKDAKEIWLHKLSVHRILYKKDSIIRLPSIVLWNQSFKPEDVGRSTSLGNRSLQRSLMSDHPRKKVDSYKEWERTNAFL